MRLAVACAVREGDRELELRLVALLASPGSSASVLIEVSSGRRQGSESAQQRRELARGGDENVADGIVLLDQEGTITWLSRSAEAIFDYPSDAAIGAHIDLILPLASDGQGSLLEQVQHTAGGPLEVTLRRRSGELVPVEVEASIAEQRERRMVVLVVRDLTGQAAN